MNDDPPVDREKRRFFSKNDKEANKDWKPNERKQRSYSIERRYRSGSIDRVHRHDNARSGGEQFEHVIAHTDRDGNKTGRK